MIDLAPGRPDLPWRELRGELHRFVSTRVDRCEVDDIVQEAMTRIHRGIGRVRDQERLGAWIYQVARNAITDHYRKARPSAPIDDEVPAPPATEPDVAFEVLSRCMTPFVAMLPAVYRQAIVMVELEGLTQVEAATRLGIPLSTMKSRVQRGRAQLRELVEECCQVGLDARGHVLDVTPRGVKCTTC